MAYSLHPDANAILVRLKREGITALYHFTSVENLHGICQMQALCSKQTLENERRRLPLVTGGNPLSHSLDRSRGNWNKVSLNLTSHTPMVYHRKREQHLWRLYVLFPDQAIVMVGSGLFKPRFLCQIGSLLNTFPILLL